MPIRESISYREFAGTATFVRAGGFDLHYLDSGPPDAAPVVLLHGFGAWSRTWRHQINALTQAGRRALAFDQIGYGASERPMAPVYSTESHALMLLEALEKLNLPSFDLVGHSFGARVAMQVAVLAPERVRQLVLIAPEAFATDRPPVAGVVRLPLLGPALAFVSLTPAFVRPGLAAVAKADDWLTDSVVQLYAAPLVVHGTLMAQVWQARSPKDGGRPVPTHLADIRQPATIIWGKDDPVFPASDGVRLATVLPQARLHVLARGGHLPHEVEPQQVNDLILAALR